jgi:hypothetical protein
MYRSEKALTVHNCSHTRLCSLNEAKAEMPKVNKDPETRKNQAVKFENAIDTTSNLLVQHHC